ncbi:TraR/DksA C4-type zinc finger protein [Caulobacter endophyticus]|uniref:Uncharacterized protein n=1 Tax=Caulobacter endophyticus TaxID=2172652 RepID=A0A2T9JY39_9CAUL|nr:hypothetical protein [Caulobacter endophyticus]PVM88619.1 hypothetical protein DDF67_13230 [Caulobacter endophyticus]
MAGGWTLDGGVLDQIEDTVTDGVLSARARLPAGESLLFCVECGEDIYGIARGVDDRPVNPDRERKSSGSETTFETNLLDTTRIETEIAALAEKVFA